MVLAQIGDKLLMIELVLDFVNAWDPDIDEQRANPLKLSRSFDQVHMAGVTIHAETVIHEILQRSVQSCCDGADWKYLACVLSGSDPDGGESPTLAMYDDNIFEGKMSEDFAAASQAKLILKFIGILSGLRPRENRCEQNPFPPARFVLF